MQFHALHRSDLTQSKLEGWENSDLHCAHTCQGQQFVCIAGLLMVATTMLSSMTFTVVSRTMQQAKRVMCSEVTRGRLYTSAGPNFSGVDANVCSLDPRCPKRNDKLQPIQHKIDTYQTCHSCWNMLHGHVQVAGLEL